jgi:predicted DCC family thiol-disulfide oxidoreductase YuxK
MSSTSEISGPVIAYFDGQCPVCVAEMSRYAKHGEHLVRLEDCTGETLSDDVDREAALKALHVRLPDGSLVVGWAAFIAIWERLPGWRVLAWLTRPAPIRIPMDALYRLIAPLRPRRTCAEGSCQPKI